MKACHFLYSIIHCGLVVFSILALYGCGSSEESEKICNGSVLYYNSLGAETLLGQTESGVTIKNGEDNIDRFSSLGQVVQKIENINDVPGVVSAPKHPAAILYVNCHGKTPEGVGRVDYEKGKQVFKVRQFTALAENAEDNSPFILTSAIGKPDHPYYLVIASACISGHPPGREEVRSALTVNSIVPTYIGWEGNTNTNMTAYYSSFLLAGSAGGKTLREAHPLAKMMALNCFDPEDTKDNSVKVTGLKSNPVIWGDGDWTVDVSAVAQQLIKNGKVRGCPR